jgi:outer membrane translocation and assembly module TamA
VGLLRLDLGFPLARSADRDEKARQLFLSIGQAF